MDADRGNATVTRTAFGLGSVIGAEAIPNIGRSEDYATTCRSLFLKSPGYVEAGPGTSRRTEAEGFIFVLLRSLTMLDLFKLIVICGTLLLCTFLVLLALPKSRLRSFMLEIFGWGIAGLSAVYVISPIDLIPDFIPVIGWIDDVGAAVGGVTAAMTAISARRERENLPD
jgi:hypothetical protein